MNGWGMPLKTETPADNGPITKLQRESNPYHRTQGWIRDFDRGTQTQKWGVEFKFRPRHPPENFERKLPDFENIV